MLDVYWVLMKHLCSSAKYCSQHVSVTVCLADTCVSQKPRVRISPNCLYMLPMVMAWSSSDGSAIHYLFLLQLPVLVWAVLAAGKNCGIRSRKCGSITGTTECCTTWETGWHSILSIITSSLSCCIHTTVLQSAPQLFSPGNLFCTCTLAVITCKRRLMVTYFNVMHCLTQTIGCATICRWLQKTE